MTILESIFEHHNWANLQIVRACAALSGDQLDAEPRSATAGSIRTTLTHLVSAQMGYLRLLTVPLEERRAPVPTPAFVELESLVTQSGEALLDLVWDESRLSASGMIRTRNGMSVEPWVILVQAIAHAGEHREQIKSMLTALGVEPPEIDALSYGESAGSVVREEKSAGG